MAHFTKERNIIKFYLNENKPENFYALDINTGILYGIKGSPIARTPNGMNNFMEYNNEARNNCVLRYMSRIHSWNNVSYAEFRGYAKELQICDKLDSIGYNPRNVSDITSDSHLEFVNKHFKEFVKYLATELPEDERHSIAGFKAQIEKAEFIRKHRIEISEYFPETWVRFLFDCSFENDKQIATAIYYLKKGIYVALGYDSKRFMRDFFYCCDKVGIDYPKGDFVREYATVKREYELRKTEFDNKALFENQMRKSRALSFSNGVLEAIIPTTTEEFLNEARQQDNCVARMYMPRVIDGRTNVVFIRNLADPEKSYITCEVRDGSIVQYLGRYNKSLYDDELAMTFKFAYIQHLNENW